jgi:hypothetical protein
MIGDKYKSQKSIMGYYIVKESIQVDVIKISLFCVLAFFVRAQNDYYVKQ